MESTGLHWTPLDSSPLQWGNYSDKSPYGLQVDCPVQWTPLHSTPLQSNIVWVDLAVERVHWSPVESIWNMGGTDKTSRVHQTRWFMSRDMGWFSCIVSLSFAAGQWRNEFLSWSLNASASRAVLASGLHLKLLLNFRTIIKSLPKAWMDLEKNPLAFFDSQNSIQRDSNPFSFPEIKLCCQLEL